MAERELDCSGMNCPMPIVKVSKEARDLEEGDVLKVTSTDPAFGPDIEAWAKKSGNRLESLTESDGKILAVIVIVE